MRTATGLLIALTGCADAAERASRDDQTGDRIVDAVVEYTIGLLDGDARYTFGSIGGVAVDPRTGRVYVADGRNHEVKVYDPDGVHHAAFGRFGVGPGDLINPCCLAFDSHGRLWVWSAADRSVRYDVFDIARERPAHLIRVAGPDIGQLQVRRTLIDESDRIVHVMYITEESADYRPMRIAGTAITPETGEQRSRVARVVLDTTGAELHRMLVPYVSPDSLGMLPVELTRTTFGVSYQRRMWLSMPGTARRLLAHAATGFAEAVSAQYLIHWYDRDGNVVGTTRRELSGPLRTAEELADAEAALQRSRESARRQRGTIPDVPIPPRKHPLEQLFFDADGRLWVQHTPAGTDTLITADVYGPDRSYLQTVRWPQHVRLTHGMISGDAAWGVSLDEWDVARLVRLTIPGLR